MYNGTVNIFKLGALTLFSYLVLLSVPSPWAGRGEGGGGCKPCICIFSFHLLSTWISIAQFLSDYLVYRFLL